MTLTDQQLLDCWDARDAGVVAQAALTGTPEAVRLTAGATRPELQRLVEAGEAACQTVVQSTLGLVGYTMRQTHISRAEHDLHQEGVLGLITAVHRYDPNRGDWPPFAFGSIRTALVGAINAEAGARQGLSVNAARDQYRYRALASSLGLDDSRAAAAHVAIATRAPVGRVEMLMAHKSNTSIDELIAMPSSGPHLHVEPGDGIDLRPYLRALPPAEGVALRAFYGVGGPEKSVTQIAADLKVSQSTARRLLVSGREHLREILERFGPEVYSACASPDRPTGSGLGMYPGRSGRENADRYAPVELGGGPGRSR